MINGAIDRIIGSVKKRGVRGFFASAFFDVVDALHNRFIRYRDRSGFKFSNNSRDKPRLVMVLAGYKPLLWPLVLDRLSEICPDDTDVCIVTAGKHVESLKALSHGRGWSYLSVEKNKTGLALNLAVKLHPCADLIHKLDEDVFLAAGYFERMESGFCRIRTDGIYDPGICVPTLNVNGVSYRWFLERLDLLESYERQFGKALISCVGVPAHHDPSAAVWIWTRSLPFDEVSSRFSRVNDEINSTYELIGTRFSIGAFLIERSFYDQIEGLRSSWREGILGVDEEGLCEACVLYSRPMFYLKDVLAGHFSFFPQEKGMLDSWDTFSQLDPRTFPDSRR